MLAGVSAQFQAQDPPNLDCEIGIWRLQVED
jgi:hypothetical protein